jgi:hypothetical protein
MTQRFKPNPHAKITHKFVTTVFYAPKATLAPNQHLLVPGSGGMGHVSPLAMAMQMSPAHSPTLTPVNSEHNKDTMMDSAPNFNLGAPAVPTNTQSQVQHASIRR